MKSRERERGRERERERERERRERDRMRENEREGGREGGREGVKEAGRGRVKERGNGRGDPCSTALTLRAGVNTSHIPRHREKHMEGPTRALAFEQSSLPVCTGQSAPPRARSFSSAPLLSAPARVPACAPAGS